MKRKGGFVCLEEFDVVETQPIIRTLRVGRKPLDVYFTLGQDGNLWWRFRPVRELIVKSNVAGFHFPEGNLWQLTQTVLNIFMFNSLRLKGHDALRIRETETGVMFQYYLERNEVVTIPTLPVIARIAVSFVLSEGTRPVLQILYSKPATCHGDR